MSDIKNKPRIKTNTIDEFINILMFAEDNQLGIEVFIFMDGYPGLEKISNPPENVRLKKKYYREVYDRDLRHKHSETIQIIGVSLTYV